MHQPPRVLAAIGDEKPLVSYVEVRRVMGLFSVALGAIEVAYVQSGQRELPSLVAAIEGAGWTVFAIVASMLQGRRLRRRLAQATILPRLGARSASARFLALRIPAGVALLAILLVVVNAVPGIDAVTQLQGGLIFVAQGVVDLSGAAVAARYQQRSHRQVMALWSILGGSKGLCLIAQPDASAE